MENIFVGCFIPFIILFANFPKRIEKLLILFVMIVLLVISYTPIGFSNSDFDVAQCLIYGIIFYMFFTSFIKRAYKFLEKKTN